MEIKILGMWCPNCLRLENNVKTALTNCWIDAKVTKVTDISDIMQYGIVSTPWLVIDEKVVSYGKVNEVDDVVNILNQYK